MFLFQNLCGNSPCMVAEERKYEVQVPMIYQQQYAYQFAEDGSEKRHSFQTAKNKMNRIEQLQGTGKFSFQQIRSNSQLKPISPNNRDIRNQHDQSKLMRKFTGISQQTRENMRPKCQKQVSKHSTECSNKSLINQVLFKSNSNTKIEPSDFKNTSLSYRASNNSSFTNNLQTHRSGNGVTVSKDEYNRIMKQNVDLKKIIESQYYPLRNCYQNLRTQQRQRGKVISNLEVKVKELGQHLRTNQRRAQYFPMIS